MTKIQDPEMFRITQLNQLILAKGTEGTESPEVYIVIDEKRGDDTSVVLQQFGYGEQNPIWRVNFHMHSNHYDFFVLDRYNDPEYFL